MYIIGLDIGTTSLCGIRCDADTGEICRSITRPNHTFLTAGPEWERLQDPYALMAALKEIAAELMEDGAASLGLTGQMHGIVYLDANGEPVGPLFTWQDGRGGQRYRDSKTYAGWLSEATGYPLAAGYGAVTHFYNTVNDLVPDGAVTFCTISDLAAMMLTGRTSPLLSPSNAASFGLFDLKKLEFDTAMIAKTGMDPNFFPEIAGRYALCGHTPNGMPVSVAIGDNQASVLGSVRDLEHSVLVNVGTGSQISCVVKAPPEPCGVDCRPLVDGYYLLAGSSLCGGRAYAILESFLREAAVAVTGQPVVSAYSAMDRLMKGFEPPAQRLLVDTAFSGTRTHPERRGKIENIGIDNLTMANLCDGVMNGMVSELHDLYLEIRPFLPQPPTRLVGSGNGIRFNAPLAERFSALFGLSMSIPVHREEAAFGAALFAMTAAGLTRTIEDAQRRIHYR